jgi:hypothetical protein
MRFLSRIRSLRAISSEKKVERQLDELRAYVDILPTRISLLAFPLPSLAEPHWLSLVESSR